MAEQLTFGLLVLDPQAHRIQSMRKSRKCLSCSSDFLSHGPGNRICPSCKQLDAWNAGIPTITVHAAF